MKKLKNKIGMNYEGQEREKASVPHSKIYDVIMEEKNKHRIGYKKNTCLKRQKNKSKVMVPVLRKKNAGM